MMNRMVIGIDYRSATGQKAGIGSYTYNLVRSLSEIDNKNSYRLYAKRVPEEADFCNIAGNNFTLKVFKYPSMLWHIRVLADILLNKIDIYHTSSFILSALLPKKSCVIFVHDITGHILPEFHTLKVRMLTSFFSKIAINKAKLILTNSLNSKKDIISTFEVSDDLVKVTPLAAAEDFRVIKDEPDENRIRSSHNLPNKFILYVGSIEPRKNLTALVNMFDEIRGKIIHKLVIVGGKGWLNSEVYNVIKKKKLQDDIIFTGYVSRRDLVFIYNLADLFVYPSFYEGFGMPVLEAMACGTPVITSNTSSLPEVVGEAGIMLNPHGGINIWASSICKLLKDEPTRDVMVLKGLEQAKRFSWEKTANDTLSAFKEVVKI